MSTSFGQFVWIELMTPKSDAAIDYYCDVVGWTPRHMEGEHAGYTVVSAGETGVGGLAELPPRMVEGGWKPAWIDYIAVDDVDAMAARITEAGGRLINGPGDIPGIGRFAVASDPQGAVFTIFKPNPGAPPPVPPGPTPGLAGWHELHTADREAAFAFYAGLFGWTKRDAIDMGPMGIYQIFTARPDEEGSMSGGMMTKAQSLPRPTWLTYFNTADIDAAATRAKAAGGQVVNGPHQVPGGAWILQCLDPQGVMFAMVGPRG